MLIEIYGIPEEAFSPAERGYFLDPDLIEEYRAPTWVQTRYRFRQLKRGLHSKQILNYLRATEAGRPTMHSARDSLKSMPRIFQVQLVSRLTKGKLVGRPTVYLIVDIFSNAIVGYAVTLENPCWATAALALYNCFSDKAAVFERLGLPYES
jgi:transposase InsO family protein